MYIKMLSAMEKNKIGEELGNAWWLWSHFTTR